TGNQLNHISDYFEGVQKYISYIKSTVDGVLDGLKIVLDGAHGATYSLAPYLFGDLEATSETIGCKPDGYNINLNVGSTHPEELAKAVIEHGADLGLAFDGDGDRIIAVDDKGQIVDGDQIMYVLAEDMAQNGELKDNMVV